MILLAMLTGCGPSLLAQPPSAELPLSLRLQQFRYLESAQPFAEWLEDEGVAAYVLGRQDPELGTWYEVHSAGADHPDALEELQAELHDLGLMHALPRDWAKWGDQAIIDLRGHRSDRYDPERVERKVGPALHELGLSLPCHPRFALEAFEAGRALGLDERIDRTLRPPGLHPVVNELAQTSSGPPPVVVQARWRDLVTGVPLSLSLVWRSPTEDLSALGQATGRLDGGWSWRAIAEDDQEFNGSTWPVALLWSPDGARVGLLQSHSPVAYTLTETLFDGGHCDAGVFATPALWRPLDILPESFEAHDQLVGLRTSVVGDDYAAGRGGVAWARRMEGRWSYSAFYLSGGEDLWSVGAFDLETAQDAERVHGGLYSAAMQSNYGSWYNAMSKAYRLDAVYKTRVRGVPAWYLDYYSSRGFKELNFHAGPFVFALDAWVFDEDPLLMEDLERRARSLPLLGGR